MKTLRLICAVMAAVFMTAWSKADCPNGLEATLEFTGDDSSGCYQAVKGGQITAEACVANCTGRPQYVRVDLFASATEFDVCKQIGSPRLVATQYIRLADGVRKCVRLAISIPRNAPSTTIYYQLRAQSTSYQDCSEIECVKIVSP